MRIEEMIIKQAALTPDRWAVADSKQRFTYKEFMEQVLYRVDELKAMGAGTGETEIFALQMPNSIAWLTDMLAVMMLGGIVLPLHPETTVEERTRLFDKIGPQWLLGMDEELRWPGNKPSPRLPLRQAASVRDLFLIGYTSGSTGEPKGYVKSHRSWTCSLEGWTEAFGLTGSERIAVPLPMSYSAQLYPAIHGLATGAEVILMESYSPGGLLAHNATCVTIIPALLDSLIRYADSRIPESLSGRMPRTVISVGTKLSAAQRASFRRCFGESSLYEYYGSSEMGYVTYLRPEEAERAPDSVGAPFPGVEIAFMDAGGHRIEAEEGRPGKLYVRTDQAFEGYAGEEALTEDCWIGEWVTSHDLGYCRKDGNIVLTGRERDVIKTGGSLVYAAEVEAALMDIEGVAEAAVIPEEDGQRGEIIHAVIVLRPEGDLALVRRHCASKLAPYKRPRKWSVVDKLPRNRNGKVVKSRIFVSD